MKGVKKFVGWIHWQNICSVMSWYFNEGVKYDRLMNGWTKGMVIRTRGGGGISEQQQPTILSKMNTNRKHVCDLSLQRTCKYANGNSAKCIIFCQNDTYGESLNSFVI